MVVYIPDHNNNAINISGSIDVVASYLDIQLTADTIRRNNLFVYFQVNNGVVYLDYYEDSHHHDHLLCSFQ